MNLKFSDMVLMFHSHDDSVILKIKTKCGLYFSPLKLMLKSENVKIDLTIPTVLVGERSSINVKFNGFNFELASEKTESNLLLFKDFGVIIN